MSKPVKQSSIGPSDIGVSAVDANSPRPLAFDVQARIDAIDQVAMRGYRLARLRAELSKRDYAGALLADPMNIRYATGARNMVLWTLHAPGRYVFVATDGPVVLFEFPACLHVGRGFETVDQLRAGISWFYMFSGPRTAEKAARWAGEVAALMHDHAGDNRRLAIDRCEPWGAVKLAAHGIQLFDAQEPLEQARCIKSTQEIECARLSMDVCDIAIQRLRAALKPKLTENQIWSTLHDTNIAHDGEYIDCRLLASGPRTNPWFQECGNRVVEAGELLSFDTDLIGPLGAMADISRTFVCPGQPPTSSQRQLYSLAQEQVLHNMALLKPGLAFDEFAAKSWRVPAKYYANRYMVLVHGVGLADEYPVVLYAGDQEKEGYEGHFAENMVVSVESYLGAEGGDEGIKLEEQVLITTNGAIPFSKTPLVNALEIK
jgi:Xaa-Pro aminopeptidase